jgi:GDP-4-dehydro-6-deoxy-D-mannose reductase
VRAVVTGSTGFSGRHLLLALAERGIEAVRVTHASDGPGLRRIDVTSARAWEEALRDAAPDLVFHLHGSRAGEAASVLAHGAGAAAALLEGAAAARCEARVLLVGSAAEYGPLSPEELPVAEDRPAAPDTSYGIAKHAQTLVGLAAAARGQRVAIARTANLVGPGAPADSALGALARQVVAVERGKRHAIESGPLDAVRDLVDVRDAVRAYIDLALSSEAAGRVVHVASGRAVRMRDALALLVDAAGVRCEVREDRARPRGVPAFVASTARLRSILGERSWIPLERSAVDMIAWARAHD